MNKLYVLVLTLSASGTISTPRGTEQTNEDGWGLNENIFLLFRSSDAASSLRPGSQSDQPNLESRYNALIFSSKFTGCSNEMQCDTTHLLTQNRPRPRLPLVYNHIQSGARYTFHLRVLILMCFTCDSFM